MWFSSEHPQGQGEEASHALSLSAQPWWGLSGSASPCANRVGRVGRVLDPGEAAELAVSLCV